MKILLFYRSLDQGGVQKMMVTLANGFVERGHSVKLLLIRKTGKFLQLVDKKVDVDELESGNYTKLIPQLKKKLDDGNFNVFFTATPSLNIVSVLAHLFSGCKTKIVLSERSDPYREFKGTSFGLYKVSFFLIPLLYRFSDKVIAVSSGVAKALSKIAFISESKIDVIYNPAYDESVLRQTEETVYHPWIHNKKYPLVISAGRLTKQKNYRLLIKSFGYLIHNLKFEARLIILGAGEEEQELRDLAKTLNLSDAIDFVGFQINPISWIRRADVFVMSSLWEGFGNILVDALAAQTTIVTTNCKSGPAEIIANGKYGYLLKSFSEVEMAVTIKKAIELPMNRSDLLQRARSFSQDNIIGQYEMMFKRLISS